MTLLLRKTATLVRCGYGGINARLKNMPQRMWKKARWCDITNDMGCFVGNQLGPIVFIDGRIRKAEYIAILEQNLLKYIDPLTADGLRDIVFQKDNARPHAATLTREWLNEAARAHGFTIMEWPPNSPDMNPIENLWAHLKLGLHRQYPDTKYLSGPPMIIRQILKRRLLKVWWDIGEDVLKGLVESMPERVKALRKVRGWYTRY
jgi:transposase